MDIAPLIEKLQAKFAKLEPQLADPEVIADRPQYRELSREYQRLRELLAGWDRLSKCRQELVDNRELLATEEDAEFRELIQADIEKVTGEIAAFERQVEAKMLPPGENDSRNTIMEIRPAAGGEEASLFAADLFRMYTRFAEGRGWKMELLHLNQTDLGGLKEVAFSLQGTDVYRALQFEGGVHRVQRIPVTETGGRIHTSTVTVAVLPEATEVDLQLDPEEIEIKFTRATGPGGQSVNTTDSAVQITHRPTGIMVQCRKEKSQHRNREIALLLLRSRLLEKKQREEQEKYAAERKAQVGTGGRSERVRTYNFPQNRVTDHRFGLSWHNLPEFMDGNIAVMFEDIAAASGRQRFEEELNKI